MNLKKLLFVVVSWLVLLTGLSLKDGPASAFEMQYTIPSKKVQMIYDDSTQVWGPSCVTDVNSGSANVKYTRVYWYPYTGGGWSILRDKDITGREGQIDTLSVPDNAHYYVLVIDQNNLQSCASNVLDAPAIITGVGDRPIVRIVKEEMFDVLGRKITKLQRSMIYFKRITYSNGNSVTKRMIYLK